MLRRLIQWFEMIVTHDPTGMRLETVAISVGCSSEHMHQTELVCGQVNVAGPADTDLTDTLAKAGNQVMIAGYGFILLVAKSPVEFAKECSALGRAGDRCSKGPGAKMLGVAQGSQVIRGESIGRDHRRFLIANGSHLH